VSAVVIAERASPTLFDACGGEPTLDEILVGAWEGLVAHRPVACPVCAGEMRPGSRAHGRPIEGLCGDCGAALT
jgi:hypothetical protein